jgi:hypothetical protein
LDKPNPLKINQINRYGAVAQGRKPVQQPFFYQCNLVTEKDFVLRYDKATINKQERGGEHENQAQSRSGDCQYEKEHGFSLNGKRS